jgi:hypothetical protein
MYQFTVIHHTGENNEHSFMRKETPVKEPQKRNAP